MDTACGPVVAFGLLVAVVVAVIASYTEGRRRRAKAAAKEAQRRQDEARRRDREDHRDAEAADRLAALWLEYKRRYPYLAKPVPANATPAAIIAAIMHELERFPAWGDDSETGLSVPGPSRERRKRHLWVIGKTGSGKTTFQEHLILQDLVDGGGVGVIAPEGELFTERLLPMLDALEEHRGSKRDFVYFAPGDSANTLTLNPLAVEPGVDPIRAAEDLFTIFTRLFADDTMGVRLQPILQNAFAALVGMPDVTLVDLKRFLSNEEYRASRLPEIKDAYVREFWEETYPRFPKNADLPIVNRLDRFLRPPAIRRALCAPTSNFSIREIMAKGSVFFVNLFGLSEDDLLVIGQVLLSRIQLELMRREVHQGDPPPLFSLYVDEFQSVAGVSVGAWRELLSRGRKYKLALTLGNQYPGQLPKDLQGELFGNVGSLVSFSLGARDAAQIHNEFLVEEDGATRAIPASALAELGIGEAYGRFGGARCVRFKANAPLSIDDIETRRRTILARVAEQFKTPAKIEGAS